MPAVFAASINSVPEEAVICLPSIVMCTSAIVSFGLTTPALRVLQPSVQILFNATQLRMRVVDLCLNGIEACIGISMQQLEPASEMRTEHHDQSRIDHAQRHLCRPIHNLSVQLDQPAFLRKRTGYHRT